CREYKKAMPRLFSHRYTSGKEDEMKKRSRCLSILLCCVLALSLGAPASALVLEHPVEGEDAGTETEIPVHDIELGPLTIGEGEALSYTVVGSQYSPEEGSGYYAGKLNVTFTGPIVIESGGCLSIGPVSIGGTEE